ncbi:MAG: hypothetical protein CEN91_338, partial [Candidatus Berkelbacteria bacterium Licking1014_85]
MKQNKAKIQYLNKSAQDIQDEIF